MANTSFLELLFSAISYGNISAYIFISVWRMCLQRYYLAACVYKSTETVNNFYVNRNE